MPELSLIPEIFLFPKTFHSISRKCSRCRRDDDKKGLWYRTSGSSNSALISSNQNEQISRPAPTDNGDTPPGHEPLLSCEFGFSCVQQKSATVMFYKRRKYFFANSRHFSDGVLAKSCILASMRRFFQRANRGSRHFIDKIWK